MSTPSPKTLPKTKKIEKAEQKEMYEEALGSVALVIESVFLHDLRAEAGSVRRFVLDRSMHGLAAETSCRWATKRIVSSRSPHAVMIARNAALLPQRPTNVHHTCVARAFLIKKRSLLCPGLS